MTPLFLVGSSLNGTAFNSQAEVAHWLTRTRQIYYQHQELFEKQRVVDDLVDDLAATLSVQRHDLNIVRLLLTWQLHFSALTRPGRHGKGRLWWPIGDPFTRWHGY